MTHWWHTVVNKTEIVSALRDLTVTTEKTDIKNDCKNNSL